MLSAKSLSRKRIFVLQMSKDTAIKSHSRNNAVRPSMKSTHELTPNICRRRANAGGNRAGETFSSSSRPSPIHFEISFREELRNWGQKKSKRLRRVIPHNAWEFGHYWLGSRKKKWVWVKLEETKAYHSRFVKWKCKQKCTYLERSRRPETSQGFHDCFPQSPRQSTEGGSS